MRQKWDSGLIVRTIRGLYDAGEDVSYKSMLRRNQPLVLAARFHFKGGYREAVETAGIDYDAIKRCPRWTAAKVIRTIRDAARRGLPLNRDAVTRRKDELGRAAMAAVRERLFGSWNDALFAAGLDPQQVVRRRPWSRISVLHALSTRQRQGLALNGSAIQKEIPSLYFAAVRHFGSYDEALRAAAIDPQQVRRVQRWSRTRINQRLREIQREHGWAGHALLKLLDPGLLSAVRRAYGTYTAAAGQLRLRTRRPLDARQYRLFAETQEVTQEVTQETPDGGDAPRRVPDLHAERARRVRRMPADEPQASLFGIAG